jgi:glycerol uptake facilitator protein
VPIIGPLIGGAAGGAAYQYLIRPFLPAHLRAISGNSKYETEHP